MYGLTTLDVRREIAVKTGANNPFTKQLRWSVKTGCVDFLHDTPTLPYINPRLPTLLAFLALTRYGEMCSSKFIAQFWRRRNTHQVECGIWMRGRSLPATNVYFSTKEDGGSFDERGTT